MGDPALVEAAASVLAKVAATLSDRREQHLLHAVSQVRRFGTRYPATFDMTTIRTGCWREEAVTIRYADKDGATTVRTILPLSIVYLDDKMTVLAWCCLRAAFRMFRADRIAAAEPAGTSFRPRRVALLRSYVAELGRRG